MADKEEQAVAEVKEQTPTPQPRRRGRPRLVKDVIEKEVKKAEEEKPAPPEPPKVIAWAVDILTLSIYPVLKTLQMKGEKDMKMVSTLNCMATWGTANLHNASRRWEHTHKDLIFDTREEALKSLDEYLPKALKKLEEVP